MIHTDTKSAYIETYNLQDFVKRVKTAKQSPLHELDSGLTGSKRFTGTETIQEAYKLVTNGYEQGIKDIAPKGEHMHAGTDPIFNRFRGTLNQSAYISGNPQPFIRYEERTTQNLRRLKIIPLLTYSGSIDQKTGLKFAKCLTATTAILNAHFDTSIAGIFGNNKIDSRNKLKTLTQINIKRYGERTLLNNIAAVYHTAFFRRIIFRHWETLKHVKLASGHGIIMSQHDTIQLQQKHKLNIGELLLVTPTLNEIDLCGKNEKEHLEEFTKKIKVINTMQKYETCKTTTEQVRTIIAKHYNNFK